MTGPIPRFRGPPAPPINRTYNGPTVPVAYDSNWQLYNNLTKDQIAWFQAQPEWQDFINYVAIAGPDATLNANVSTTTINSVLSAKPISLNAGPISK